MKTTCINHPPNEPLLLIRQWQVEACDGDHCAAAILSFLEYWHNIKMEQATKSGQANDVAERHGDGRTQDESLTQWHTSAELEKGMLGLFATRKISEGVELLKAKGFIRVFRNPNPRYKFDATKHFVFEDGAVNEWINSRYGQKAKPSAQKGETGCRKGKTGAQKGQFSNVAETTSETTSEKDCAAAPALTPAGPVSKPKSETKHQTFVRLWCERYLARNGAEYPKPNGREWKAAAEVTGNGSTPEQLVELADWAWSSLGADRQTNYVWQQAQTIHGFAAQLAVIQGLRTARCRKPLTEAQKEANVEAGDGWKNSEW